MALFRTLSAAIQGIDAHVVEVEVDMYPAGTTRDFVTVGMPDAAVKESRERIKSALLNSGFGYPEQVRHDQSGPRQRAERRRGIRPADGRPPSSARWALFDKSDDYMLVGELSLDGSLRPVRGALSIAVAPRGEASATCWFPPRTQRKQRWPKAFTSSA